MKARLALLWLLLVTLAKGEVGIASFVDPRLKGQLTASGEAFLPERYTAASWRYFKCWLRVTSLRDGRSVVVYVNDRGPNKRLSRMIDLSPAAFEKLANLSEGLLAVRVEVLVARSP